MNTFNRLYQQAHKLSAFQQLSKYASCGGCGSALITKGGHIYSGKCIDCASSLGFCAEHAAIAEMLKNGESEILEIIAVGEDGTIMAPCGRCREMIAQINPKNADTLVHLSGNRLKKLSELLPEQGY